ncbi:MAG: MarR family transcriptional regulator [Promethearchaeota archaeon]
MKSNIRYKILVLLSLFPDLSLKNIYTKLGVSKSTVFRHLKALEELGFVEVRRINNEKGWIYENRYRIQNRALEKLVPIDLRKITDLEPQEEIELLQDFAHIVKNFTSFLSYASELYNFWLQTAVNNYNPAREKKSEETIKEKETGKKKSKKGISFDEPYNLSGRERFFSSYLLTDKEYEEYKVIFQEYWDKIEKLIRKQDLEQEYENIKKSNPDEQITPYYIFFGTLPLKDLIEFKSKYKNDNK